MKKYLLVSAAALAATTGFAQVASVQMQKVKAPAFAPMQKAERMAKKNGPKKSYSNQTYYLPQGGLYAGWNIEGYGTSSALLVVPPFKDITFINKMGTPTSGVWQINSEDASDYAVDGNFVMQYGAQGTYYAPTLFNGSIQYQFGETNYYYKSGKITSLAQAGMVKTSTDVSFSDGASYALPLYAVNDHGYVEQNGQTYQNTAYGYGFLDQTAFLFGEGTVDGVRAVSCTQYFPACDAPIYADDVFVRSLTYNDNGPIPANDTIYAYVTDAEEVTDEDGSVSYKPGSTVYATLYATAESATDFTYTMESWDPSALITDFDTSVYGDKAPVVGMLTYYNTEKTVDPIMGSESPNPIVIPAGKPFAITLADMDKTGVSLGFPGVRANDEDFSQRGSVNMSDGTSYTYQNNYGIPVALNGGFEYISIAEKDFLTYESEDGFPTDKFYGWNALRVSDDAASVSTEGLSGTDYDLGAALVGTTYPWVDENDNSNYTVEVEYLSGGEGWITGINYNNEYYSANNALRGYNFIVPQCDALPSGVTGRSARLIIHGKGDIASESAVYVLQGDADAATGINNAVEFNTTKVANATMYNLAGQKVGKDYKGIVIQNGKKFFNK